MAELVIRIQNNSASDRHRKKFTKELFLMENRQGSAEASRRRAAARSEVLCRDRL
jgi:hypothetical protein